MSPFSLDLSWFGAFEVPVSDLLELIIFWYPFRVEEIKKIIITLFVLFLSVAYQVL